MAKRKLPKPRSDADRRIRQCERLARLMRTLQLISGKGRWDANALAEELECSRRTVHRLLQTLSIAGVPWYFDEATKAYRVRPGYKFPAVEDAPVGGIREGTELGDFHHQLKQVAKDAQRLVENVAELEGLLRSLTAGK